jgi:spore maturation protein A
MMNKIFGLLLVVSTIIGITSGHLEETASAVFDGASGAVTLILKIAGSMCFWCGIMEVARRAGLTRSLSFIMSPIVSLLFPHVKKNSPAHNAISMNMTANLLGLANAATPLGLKAMDELDKMPHKEGSASREMCMLVVVNTASIQLIPSTLIAMRIAAGSNAPFEIIPAVWCASVISVTGGVLMLKLLWRLQKGDNKWN